MKKIILLSIALLMISCKTQLIEPEIYIDNISGRYQNDETAIVLLLEHYKMNVEVTVHIDGKVFTAKGKFDKINKQVMFAGRCYYPQYGELEMSFILNVYDDKRLVGNYLMQNELWNTGSRLIIFTFVNSLQKHNQGGIIN